MPQRPGKNLFEAVTSDYLPTAVISQQVHKHLGPDGSTHDQLMLMRDILGLLQMKLFSEHAIYDLGYGAYLLVRFRSSPWLHPTTDSPIDTRWRKSLSFRTPLSPIPVPCVLLSRLNLP